MNKCLWFVVVFQLIITSAYNQSLNKLEGKVSDATAKPVAGATIHLLNTVHYVLSNDSGHFIIPGLPAGSYIIEVSAAGFATTATTAEANGHPVLIALEPLTLQLEMVTITADKREALLQQQASSVTAITSNKVMDYRLWNVKDISGIVPGLFAGNPGDERNVTSIRGITTTSYDPAVTTYVDGVNQFNLDTYIPQLNDIERIEVLRGPQGTLYGRNAMGGVINIITKQPGNTTSGFAEINFGNFNQQRYTGGIRTPIVKHKLFFGASASYTGRDGYYTNEFNNSSFDKQGSLSGNYYLKYLPSSKWMITANIKHQNTKNNGAFALVPGKDEAFNNPFKLNQNAIGKMMDNTMNGSLSVQHFGARANFSSITAFQNNHRYYSSPVDADFSPFDGITLINDYGKKWNNVKVVTQEFRMSSPANKSSSLSWSSGAYLFYQYNPVKQATHFGTDAGMLGIPVSEASSINTSEGKNAGVALFGQANYSLSKKLIVFGGLRYDYENRELMVKGEFQPDGDDIITTTPDTSASNHFSALSPKIGLQFILNTHSNIYTSYSRGFRTGGLTQLSGDPSQPPLYPYDPEFSNNIEIGVKNNLLNNRLRINAAAFLTYVTNAQVPMLVLPDAITITRNAGSLNSKGLELELASTLLKGLELEYSVGYTDASYKSLKVGSNGQVVDLGGKKQIFTPDLTSFLALQYVCSISKKHHLQLVARGEYFYFGERYFDLANTIRQSPYNLLNTRVGITSNHLSLFFWARNIGDRHYMEYAYDFGAIHLAAPQTYGITIRSSF